MDSSFSPAITSFVIRFILEEPSETETPPVQHIIVRHVQSDQEISCSRWADVVTFVRKFVPLDSET